MKKDDDIVEIKHGFKRGGVVYSDDESVAIVLSDGASYVPRSVADKYETNVIRALSRCDVKSIAKKIARKLNPK